MATQIASSPSRALHELLMLLAADPHRSLKVAWSEVLEAEYGSKEWAQRHGQVVGLFNSTLRELEALPPGARGKDRGLRYAPKWYDAIVWPKNWDVSAASVIDTDDLDHLESAADLVEVRRSATHYEPQGALSALRDQANEWLVTLDLAVDLNSDLRAQIRAQLVQIIWLIDHAQLFGVSPILGEAEKLVGKVSTGIALSTVPENRRREWISRVGAFIVAIGLVTQAAEATTLAVEAVQDTIHTVIDVADDIGYSNRSRPLQLEPSIEEPNG